MEKQNKKKISKLDMQKFCQRIVKTPFSGFSIDNGNAIIDNGENQQVTKPKNPLSKTHFSAFLSCDNDKTLKFSIVEIVVTLSMNFHYQGICKY